LNRFTSTVQQLSTRFQLLDIFAAANRCAMNLQDILFPLRDLFLWTFELLKLGGDNFNWLLILIFAAALAYWTVKLAGYQKDEVPNR